MIGYALLHFIKCRLGLEKPDSQTTLAEQRAIGKYAEGARVAVEIGVYEGVNTAIIAYQILGEGKLYAIDPFFKGKLGISYHEEIAKNQIKKNNLVDKVVFVPKLSFDALADVPDNIDFIFVDGDHSYEGIKRDWELFSSKIKQGGIVALHDTSVPSHDASVAQLGSYLFFNDNIIRDARFERIETIDSLNILRRIN